MTRLWPECVKHNTVWSALQGRYVKKLGDWKMIQDTPDNDLWDLTQGPLIAVSDDAEAQETAARARRIALQTLTELGRGWDDRKVHTIKRQCYWDIQTLRHQEHTMTVTPHQTTDLPTCFDHDVHLVVALVATTRMWAPLWSQRTIAQRNVKQLHLNKADI